MLSAQGCVASHVEGVYVFWVRKTLEYLRPQRLLLTHHLTEHRDERETHTPLCLMVTSASRLAYLTPDRGIYLSVLGLCCFYQLLDVYVWRGHKE